MREYHVRICEGLGVKFPGSTRHSLLMRLVPASHDVRSTLKADIRFQRAGRDRATQLCVNEVHRRCAVFRGLKLANNDGAAARSRTSYAGVLICRQVTPAAVISAAVEPRL